jgi:hypothetical protein
LFGAVGESDFFLDYYFIGLGKFGFSFEAETAGVVEELVDGLIGDFSVEKFADAGLRLGENDLEFFLGAFFGELQDRLIELGFEFHSDGVLWRKTELVNDVAIGYMPQLGGYLLHFFLGTLGKPTSQYASRCISMSWDIGGWRTFACEAVKKRYGFRSCKKGRVP